MPAAVKPENQDFAAPRIAGILPKIPAQAESVLGDCAIANNSLSPADAFRYFRWCNRAIKPDGIRALTAAAAVMLVSIMVLTLASAFKSGNETFSRYVDREHYDIWVTPIGSDNLVRASGRLPMAMERHLKLINGVKSVDPVVRAFIMVKNINGDMSSPDGVALFAFAYRVDSGLGGPPILHRGKAPDASRQITLDRTTAYRLGVDLGGTVEFAGRDFEITGITDGTNIIVSQLAFLNIDDPVLKSITSGGASFFVVEVDPDASVAAVRAEIQDLFPDTVTYDRESFADRNRREAAAGYVDLLYLVYGIGYMVSFVVVGMMINGMASEKRVDLAVLAALGVRERYLMLSLFMLGARLAFLGAVSGVAVAFVIGEVLDIWHPILPVQFSATQALSAVGIFMVAGAIAAIIPIIRLRRIDPLEAFRP